MDDSVLSAALCRTFHFVRIPFGNGVKPAVQCCCVVLSNETVKLWVKMRINLRVQLFAAGVIFTNSLFDEAAASVGGKTYHDASAVYALRTSGEFSGGPNLVTGNWGEVQVGASSLWYAAGRVSSASALVGGEFYYGTQIGNRIDATRVEVLWAWSKGFTPTVKVYPFSATDRLTLPKVHYAVVGEQTGIVFENLIGQLTSAGFRFDVTCDIGTTTPADWTVTPTAAHVGDHLWQLQVWQGNNVVDTGSTLIRVTPADAGAGRPISLLMVGDSLTHNSIYPNNLAARCAAADGPQLTLLGTHHPRFADPNVYHEGYGGYTWNRFLTHYEPHPDPANGIHSSPFVFLINGQPTFDIPKYYRVSCDGKTPDFVTILLGINDCLSFDPANPAQVDAQIDQVLTSAESVILGFRIASPRTEIGVCLTLPPNGRESAFTLNYQGRFTRKNWKPVQHRLVERMLARFEGREIERIFIVPTGLSLSPMNSFPEDNATHPNAQGYREITNSLHSWMRARIQARTPF